MGAGLEAGALTRRDAAEAVRRTPGLGGLAGQRLLLTGGTGFAGSWLLELIAALNDGPARERPCTVTVVARHPEAWARRAPHLASNPHVRLVSADVCALEPGFLKVDAGYDAVIHAAAPADPVTLTADPAAVRAIIVEGTRRVLAWAQAHRVPRLLMVSSGAAEQGGLAPGRSAYAAAKQEAESLCADAGALAVSIARPYAFVGPYQALDAGFAVTDFIRDGLRGGPIAVRGGDSVRSYAYGAELALWLLEILLRGEAGGRCALGSAEAMTVQALAGRVQEAFRRAGRDVRLRVEPAPGASTRYLPDPAGMDSLGLGRLWTIDEALDRTIAWFRLREGTV
jgi:dTDP-glucose 4,6-dehydratase